VRANRGRRREREGDRDRREGEGKNSPSRIQIPVISTPNPRAPRGERGGRGRGRLLRGRNQMSQTNLGKGAHMGERRGARGARAGPGRAGLGWAGLDHYADRNPRQARPLNGLQSRVENRNRTRRTYVIRQRNVRRHDATPMTLRFCSYITRTPVTILVLNLGRRSETGREKRVTPEFGERKEEKNSTPKFRALQWWRVRLPCGCRTSVWCATLLTCFLQSFQAFLRSAMQLLRSS
jgi:hypothetical protein